MTQPIEPFHVMSREAFDRIKEMRVDETFRKIFESNDFTVKNALKDYAAVPNSERIKAQQGN